MLDDGGVDVGFIQNDDYIMFRRMNFGAGADSFSVSAGSETEGGRISLRLDSASGKEIGSCTITGTNGWTSWKDFTCEVTGAAGIHDLYLVFEGDDGFLMNIDSFRFSTDKLVGDVDGSGKVDADDAVMMLNHLLTKKLLTEAQGARADIESSPVFFALSTSSAEIVRTNTLRIDQICQKVQLICESCIVICMFMCYYKNGGFLRTANHL